MIKSADYPNSEEDKIHLNFAKQLKQQEENLLLISQKKVICAGDIVKMEALGSYTKFHLADGLSFISPYNLGRQEKIISNPYFIRIHKSFIVNMCYVSSVTVHSPMIIHFHDAATITVSRRKEKLIRYQIRNLFAQVFAANTTTTAADLSVTLL